VQECKIRSEISGGSLPAAGLALCKNKKGRILNLPFEQTEQKLFTEWQRQGHGFRRKVEQLQLVAEVLQLLY
jgi:hypothetical protein